MASVLEIEPTRATSSTLLIPKSEENIAQSGIIFDHLAAQRLASNYLAGKPHELKEYRLPVNATDAYAMGRMDIRAKVLTIIGQAHILTLNSKTVDIDRPPMVEIKPVSREEIGELIELYKKARQFLNETGCSSKPITKITSEEAMAKGQMVELANCLLSLGKKP